MHRTRQVCAAVDAGVIALTAFISPSKTDRQKVKDLVGDDYIEIYCDCPIEVCEERDVKGLYKRARAGEIKDFTGISAPYDIPKNPNLVVDTSGQVNIGECAERVISMLMDGGILKQ